MVRTCVLTLLALGLLVAAPGGSPVPVAQDCADTDSGWGWENPSCHFGCNSGDTIKVVATVDDSGTISGSGACEKAGASCGPENDGHCSDSSSPVTATAAGVGLCSGSGNGGGPWTRARVYCASEGGSGDSTANELIGEINTECNADLALLETDFSANSLTVIQVNLEAGEFSGRAYTHTGSNCWAYWPLLKPDVDLGAWTAIA